MNKLQVFKNHEFGEIRTVQIKGEPYFVGKDIAERLGYERPTKAIQDHVDVEDKDVIPIQDSIGRFQNTPIINESGLYSLILSSKLPRAKQFKLWVTREVIPIIRKTGAYMTPEKAEEVLLNPDTIIKLATQIKELQAEARSNAPKVLFADAVSVSQSTILIGELAKLLRGNGIDIGQNRLFQWMRDEGYLIKAGRSDYNTPTQKAMDLGLFKVKETVITHSDGHTTIRKTTKVTGKGQQFFINLFLNER